MDLSSLGTVVVLVRHAVTPHTNTILTGRAPGVSLSDEGRAQADALAKRLAQLPITALYASPIERTMETAGAIGAACGLSVQQHVGVIEVDYGDWTGGVLAELAQHDLWKQVQRSPSRVRFPGGESLAEMQTRVVHAIDEIAAQHRGEVIVIVSHADPIRAAVAAYTGLHLDLYHRLIILPASVTALALSDEITMLLTCNDTGALPGTGAATTPKEPA
ncbi:MAG: MSMEG_4193 family putative phosphomutase [Acidimicrobiia bacterium]